MISLWYRIEPLIHGLVVLFMLGVFLWALCKNKDMPRDDEFPPLVDDEVGEAARVSGGARSHDGK